MSRRIDIRPLKKLRNPARHLRSLERWALDVDNWLPGNEALENWEGRYWHVKVPIYDKLVSSRGTTQTIRATVAQSLLDAAARVSARLDLRRTYRVACLISPEDLFGSEVTVFFDESYFQTFLPPKSHQTTRLAPFTVSTEPARMNLVSDWGLVVPKALVDFGGYRLAEHEDGEPHASRLSHNWIFAEPAFLKSQDGSRPSPG